MAAPHFLGLLGHLPIFIKNVLVHRHFCVCIKTTLTIPRLYCRLHTQDLRVLTPRQATRVVFVLYDFVLNDFVLYIRGTGMNVIGTASNVPNWDSLMVSSEWVQFQ